MEGSSGGGRTDNQETRTKNKQTTRDAKKLDIQEKTGFACTLIIYTNV